MNNLRRNLLYGYSLTIIVEGLNKGANILLLPLLMRHFRLEDFGNYAYYLSLGLIVTNVLNSGINSAETFLYYKRNASGIYNRIWQEHWTKTFLLTLIIVIPGIILLHKSSPELIMALLIGFLAHLKNLLFNYLKTVKKNLHYSLLNLTASFINIALTVLLFSYFQNASVASRLLSIMLSYLPFLLSGFFYLFALEALNFNISKRLKALFIKAREYFVPFIVFNMAGPVLILVLKWVADEQVVGLYFLVVQFSVLVSLALNLFLQYFEREIYTRVLKIVELLKYFLVISLGTLVLSLVLQKIYFAFQNSEDTVYDPSIFIFGLLLEVLQGLLSLFGIQYYIGQKELHLAVHTFAGIVLSSALLFFLHSSIYLVFMSIILARVTVLLINVLFMFKRRLF